MGLASFKLLTFLALFKVGTTSSFSFYPYLENTLELCHHANEKTGREFTDFGETITSLLKG